MGFFNGSARMRCLVCMSDIQGLAEMTDRKTNEQPQALIPRMHGVHPLLDISLAVIVRAHVAL